MPEMIEVEMYRRLAETTVGHEVSRVHAPDAWFLKGGASAPALRRSLTGRIVTGTGRIGKLLILETDGPSLGLRFGMTGRLLLGDVGPIERLEYSSHQVKPEWVRFALHFAAIPPLQLVDPRRLGGVELEPDESRLGPDARRITLGQLRAVLAGSRAPLKAVLLDQHRIAGIGNLLADEMLWRAGIDPARPAQSLSDDDVKRLHRHMRSTIDLLTRRGGSHTGDLQVARVRGATCPRDGTPLLRRTIGTRTTYSCPQHQV